eukprot:4613826-Amphidinium_carterae.1
MTMLATSRVPRHSEGGTVLFLVKEVFQLQVSMDNTMSVNIVDGQEHLPHCICGILLAEFLSLTDTMKQLT